MGILESIAVYVGDKFLAQYIKDQIWVKRIWNNISPPKKFKYELIREIYKTIDEYQKSNSIDESNGNFPFYKSQVFLEHFSKYVFFGNDDLSEIEIDFSMYPKCIPPSKNDLEKFYDLFYKNLKSNESLKNLYIDENYKNRIFSLSESIKEIKKITNEIKKDTTSIRKTVDELLFESSKNKLTTGIVVDSLKAQAKRQIEKQINTGKYLRNTFIELGDQKEQLRYLSDSLFYSEKVFDELRKFDFRYLNTVLRREKQESFDFEFIFENPNNISEVKKVLSDVQVFLLNKKEEVKKYEDITYTLRGFDLKFRDYEDDIKALISSATIITESAGQGKTNFICDFAENFLNNKGIPYVFLTGIELDANDIRKSILKKVFPNNKTYIFQDFLNILQNYCHDNDKYFVIIIDGINENTKVKLLSDKLEEFLSEILEFDFVKIILSCRTEYYQQNFKNMENSSFKDKLLMINSLFSYRYNHDNVLKGKLIYTYFDYFKINYSSISNEAEDQLTNNLLLLRIFCEVHQNESLTIIHHIYKNRLFEAYYNVKLEEINKRLNLDDFNIGGTMNVKKFITDIVEYMINNQLYANIPLDNIVSENENRDVYIRFLDENILVKRDLANNEIYSSSEVVNFTFDEFRDFLISKYLIENLYANGSTDFQKFLNTQLTTKSPILEGCGTFIFFISKTKKDEMLNQIIESQVWYDNIFLLSIFEVPDDEITEKDKSKIKNLLSSSEKRHEIIFDLILRYRLHEFKNLNIEDLLSILREFSEEEYKVFINSFGRDTHHVRKIDQENLCEQLGNILEDEDFSKKMYFHNLFEILIYMFMNVREWQVKDLYNSYYYKYPNESKDHLKKALTSNNGKLVNSIKKFIDDYEISI